MCKSLFFILIIFTAACFAQLGYEDLGTSDLGTEITTEYLPLISAIPGDIRVFTYGHTYILQSFTPGDFNGSSASHVILKSDSTGLKAIIDLSLVGNLTVSNVDFQDITFIHGTITNTGIHYIDFIAGSDTLNGNTKSTAWQHYPGMLHATGSPLAYIHTVLDTFIFKGGISWDSTCFPMTVDAVNTTNGSGYVFTVDSTWHIGGSFSRPIFNGTNKKIPNASGFVICQSKSNVIFNCFELKDYASNTNEGDPIGWNCILDSGVIFTNNYIHSIHANGNVDNNSAPFTFNACSVVVIRNNTITGVDSAGFGVYGYGAYGNNYNISYNTISHNGGGIYINCTNNNNVNIHHNTMTNIYNGKLNATEHSSAILVSGGGYGQIHHNSVSACSTAGIWTNGGKWKVYDNKVYDNYPNLWLAFGFKSLAACPTCSVEVWNNYSDGYFRQVPTGYKTGYADIKNNIFSSINLEIDTISNLSINNNLITGDSTNSFKYRNVIMSSTATRSAGYNINGYWKPSIVNAIGFPYSNSYAMNNGVNLYTKFTTDFNDSISPSSNSWTIGAYQTTPKQFTLTANGSGNGSISPSSGALDSGRVYTLIATPTTHNLFVNFTKSNINAIITDTSIATTSFYLKGSTTITANFIAIDSIISCYPRNARADSLSTTAQRTIVIKYHGPMKATANTFITLGSVNLGPSISYTDSTVTDTLFKWVPAGYYRGSIHDPSFTWMSDTVLNVLRVLKPSGTVTNP